MASSAYRCCCRCRRRRRTKTKCVENLMIRFCYLPTAVDWITQYHT
jgi:hypothetical protein